MPIYAYRCTSCGFEKDHLQKLSDPVLVTCPECCQDTYKKQVTAALGFQLKGSGWYATDFKTNNHSPAKTETPHVHSSSCECCPGAKACAGN
jgi:putative FmdB family regulatory protein